MEVSHSFLWNWTLTIYSCTEIEKLDLIFADNISIIRNDRVKRDSFRISLTNSGIISLFQVSSLIQLFQCSNTCNSYYSD